MDRKREGVDLTEDETKAAYEILGDRYWHYAYSVPGVRCIKAMVEAQRKAAALEKEKQLNYRNVFEHHQLGLEIAPQGTMKKIVEELNAANEILDGINCPRKYVQINGVGPTYCLHGTSSIDAYDALAELYKDVPYSKAKP